MQDFTSWTNLSEAVFVLNPTDPRAHYRLRIFDPTRELPFAGHPTLGARAGSDTECLLIEMPAYVRGVYADASSLQARATLGFRAEGAAIWFLRQTCIPMMK